MNSVTQENGYAVAWAAPEVLEGADMITREADVFALSMVVIKVCSCVLPDLVLEVEGWMARLTSESYLRFLQESPRSVNPQPQSSLQRLWVANARSVPKRRKNEG